MSPSIGRNHRSARSNGSDDAPQAANHEAHGQSPERHFIQSIPTAAVHQFDASKPGLLRRRLDSAAPRPGEGTATLVSCYPTDPAYGGTRVNSRGMLYEWSLMENFGYAIKHSEPGRPAEES